MPRIFMQSCHYLNDRRQIVNGVMPHTWAAGPGPRAANPGSGPQTRSPGAGTADLTNSQKPIIHFPLSAFS